jgi:hypothetical protein
MHTLYTAQREYIGKKGKEYITVSIRKLPTVINVSSETYHTFETISNVLFYTADVEQVDIYHLLWPIALAISPLSMFLFRIFRIEHNYTPESL